MYNPDVLTCLANLSSDEVFTPPDIANKMLDMLPEDIWHDSRATFLAPACKSGVFLREIAKRLIEGLTDEFPNLQERIDHIFCSGTLVRKSRCFSKKNLRICSFAVIISSIRHFLSCFLVAPTSIITLGGYALLFSSFFKFAHL